MANPTVNTAYVDPKFPDGYGIVATSHSFSTSITGIPVPRGALKCQIYQVVTSTMKLYGSTPNSKGTSLTVRSTGQLTVTGSTFFSIGAQVAKELAPFPVARATQLVVQGGAAGTVKLLWYMGSY